MSDGTKTADELLGRIAGLESELDERGTAIASLEATNADLERFVQIAAHDLQEPVRAIASFTQLLQEECGEALSGDAVEYMAFVREGAARLQGLIHDLGSYGRVGRRRDEPQSCDLGEIVATVLTSAEAAIQDAGIEVTVHELPIVQGIPADLREMFRHLVDNGIRYRGDEAPFLRISSALEDGRWCISVEDNGLGIDDQYQEQVFEVFRRLHGRSVIEGNGIGLAIVRRAAKKHGGDVSLQSELGKGSVFRVDLPRTMNEH